MDTTNKSLPGPAESIFKTLAAIDCSKHVEKKGKFSYLSWPWAVRTLRETDPSATWEVLRFDGLPYQQTELGTFVEVAVTVQGITLSQIHPVLDQANRPIAKPNAFQINTSIQRCLVKAIALHGLGLYIYAGEDLPTVSEDASEPKIEPELRPQSPSQFNKEALEGMDDEMQSFLRDHAVELIAMHEDGKPMLTYLNDLALDTDEKKMGLWALLPSKVRTAIKKEQNKPTSVDLASQP
jgi:uncharacterized protein DUF1071